MKTSEKGSYLEAEMETDLYGAKEEPVLEIKIKNVGVDPIKVDR